MKVFNFKRIQNVPISLEEAWRFFSSPNNLKTITPDYLKFKIESNYLEDEIYPGKIITYKVRPLFNIPVSWMTEITQVKDYEYFIDEQKAGPYAIWHHQHFFKEIEGGVELTDLIHYAIHPLQGGQITNALFVKSKLKAIFDYRYQTLQKLFGTMPEQLKMNV